ncbi:MAG: hypothetical protein ACK4M6_14435, partial [Hyphomonas sp.]
MRLFATAAGIAISIALSACGGSDLPADEAGAVDAAVATEAAAAPDTAAATAPRLEQLWVATGFEAPEGAALGPDGTYFISNVAGDGSAKAGNGFVSKVDTDGTVLMLRWA